MAESKDTQLVEYFASTVHRNGKDLEKRVENYLKSSFIPFKRNTHSGIDFIIGGDIYMDCVSTSQSGSIDDKMPTKCFKYIKKYNLKEIYILHPYSPISKSVAELFEHLENTMDVKIHILDWNDFTYLANGSRFEKRKAYNFVSNTTKVRNLKTADYTIKKFFKL